MITSLKNQQIKDIMLLNKKTKERVNKDAFIVEGTKMVEEVPLKDLIKVFYSKSYYDQLNEEHNASKYEDYEIIDDQVFKQITDTKTPQGILAIVKRQHYKMDDLLNNKQPLIVIVEDLQDPGNLGTLIRTAEGAGVHGIILTRNSVDLYNPKVVRATMGAIFRMPYLIADDLIATITELKKYQMRLYAAHLQATTIYDQCDYWKGTAFLIGNESRGLSDAITQQADTLIKIPLQGQVESLNASIAASLLMYEAARQRRKR